MDPDEQPFTFSAANAEQSRSGESTTTDEPRPGAPDRHTFIRFANSRYETCVRCGRPEHDVVHERAE